MPRAVWEPVVKQEVEEEKAHDTSFANVIWTAADGLEAFEADDDGDGGEDDDDGGINFGRPEFRGARFDTGNLAFRFQIPTPSCPPIWETCRHGTLLKKFT